MPFNANGKLQASEGWRLELTRGVQVPLLQNPLEPGLSPSDGR